MLGSKDPLSGIQEVHWEIHTAHHAYQAAAEERRQLAADAGELTAELVTAVAAAGRTK